MDIHLQQKEELTLHKKMWDRHFEILLYQEALLHDLLNDLGYKAAALGNYNIPECSMDTEDHVEIFRMIPSNAVTGQRSDEEILEEDDEFNDALEESDEETDETLAQLEAECVRNEIVNKYKGEVELPGGAYPPRFERLLPRLILKALFYCTSDEREQLIEEYSVPRHVAVVLRYADEAFPESVRHWSLGRHLHPAVLKALFYAK